MENKDQSNSVLLGESGDGAPIDYGFVKEPPPDPNALSLEPGAAEPLISQEQPEGRATTFLRFVRRLDVMLAALLLVAGSVALFAMTRGQQPDDVKPSLSSNFGNVEIPLDEIVNGKDLSLSGIANVTINGPMQLNSGLFLAPSLQPTGAKAGQIYFDQGTNQLAYFNGETFVFLTTPSVTPGDLQALGRIESLGGVTGAVGLGGGLAMSGNQLSNTGVLTVQGQGGNVALTAGPGIVINGTTFSNSGVLSIASASPNVAVTNDGNGNVSLSVTSGAGTITSSGGTAGNIAMFTGSQNIEDSIITQSGLTVTISGDLSVVTGGLTLSNALTVSNGGTGSTSFANNGVLVGSGTAPVSAVAAGGPGLCLVSTNGAPVWAACPSGNGVVSLNGLAGALGLANASAAGSTITIDDASTTTKGIASFNSTNFTASGGAVNTVQDINTAATPTFAGVNTNSITPSAALTVGVSAQTALLQGSTTTITSNGAGNNIVLNSAATIELQDNTNVTGNLGLSGDIAVNGGDITSTGALNITPGGALTIGASSQVLTLQGGATSTFRATSGANTTVIGFTSPTANTTLNFPALAAGTYTICTTSGNCAGTAVTLQSAYDNSTNPEIVLDATRGAMTIRDNSTPLGANLLEVQNNAGNVTYLGVTASGVAVTGTAVITGNINSSGGALQTNGTTRIDNSGNLLNIASVTASGNATFQGGAMTLGTNSQAGSLVLYDGSSNTGTLQTAALGQNTIYTLPDPGVGSATICLDTGNCAGVGGGVTTAGGTTNRLAKFNASQAIADSTITDDGTTVTTSVNLVIQGGVGTIGVAGVQSGSLVLAYGGGSFMGTLVTDTLTANQTYTLPNASGTFCLTSGNCAGVGGTGDILQGGNNFGTAMTIGTNDNFALNLRTNGVNRFTIANDGSQATLGTNMDLVLQGTTAYISNSQGQTDSEVFGLNATANGANAVAVGNGAVAEANAVAIGRSAGAASGTFGGPVSIGDNANAASWGVSIGQDSTGTGNNAIAIGNNATAALDAIAIGAYANASQNGIALGVGATTGGNNRIAIGTNALNTADFQMVIGSDDLRIDDVYIGNGVTNAAPNDLTIHATGGSGTDVSGGDLNLAAGAGTGSAAGGDLNFQVATPGASGSTANVPATVASLSGATGAALFKNLVNSASAFEVQTAGGAATLSVDTTNGRTTVVDLMLNGSTLSSTGALNITPAGTLTAGVAGQQLILQGNSNTRLIANGNGFTTTVGFTGTATGNVTYNFDRAAAAGTYTICTTIGNCAGTGGGVTTSGGTTGALAKFTGTNTLGDSLLSESGSTVTVNGNLNLVSGNQFQVNGTQISSANLSNDANLAKLSASQTFTGNTVAFQNGTNSTNAFNIQNQSGDRVLTVDTTNGQVVLGTSSALDGKVVFNNMSNGNTVTIVASAVTGNRTLTLPDASGIICTDSGNCAGAGATLQTGYNFSVGGTTPKIKVNSTLLGVDIQDADTTINANLFNIRASNGAGLGSVMFGVGNTGAVTLQNATNSTAAFRLLTQGGTSVLTGDTQNGAIYLGQAGTLDGTLIFNTAGSSNTVTVAAAALTGNHTITLPNATGTICLSSGNCSGAGSSNTLQAAYDAGNTITTSNARDIVFNLADTVTDGNFLVDLQCDTSCGSNGRFAIQDDGADTFAILPAGGAIAVTPTVDSTTAFNLKTSLGNNMFTIDTTNSRVGINLGSNNLPTIANNSSGLHLQGALRITGSGIDDFTTPIGTDIEAKINVSVQSLSNFAQVMAMGIDASSNATSRVLTLFDARTVRHQPTIAVMSPDENSSVGFSWNGSNSTATVQTSDAGSSSRSLILQSGNVTTTGSSGDVQINTGAVSAGSGGTTGTIYVVSGDGSGTNTSSGNVVIDSGVSTGSGTRGAVNIGVTNSNNVTIGRSAGTVTLQGGITTVTGAFTVSGGATSLTGATSGNALTVSNSTSTGSIALFRDNSTTVLDIADGGVITATPTAASTTAFAIQSPSYTLFSADTVNNTVRMRGVADNQGTFNAIWLQGEKNGVTALIGGNDDTSGYGANEFSGNLRFNGSNVGWGDFGYYPQGGGNGNNGVFRLSTAGSAVNTTPNAKLGIGDLYVNGNAGIGTNSPGYRLDVAGDVNISSGSSYRINGTAICTSAGCAPSAGSANYIQNATSGPQTANFNIISSAAGNIAARIEGAANQSAQVLLVRAGSNPTNNALEVQNSAGTQIFAVDPQNTRVIVGSNCSSGRLCVGQSTTGSGSGTVTNLYNQQNINMSGGTGTWIGQNIVLTDTSSSIGTTLKGLIIDTSGTTNTSANINSIEVTVPSSASGNFLSFRNGSTTTLNVSNGGAMQIQTAFNSTSAFRVQDASSNTLLNIDTTNGWVINNGSTAAFNLLESPSFEANGSFTSTGWNFSSQGQISSAGTPHHGNYEFVYTPNGTQLILSSYKYVSVQPGDQYYAEAWYKVAPGTNGAASFSFTYYDKNKVNIGSSSVSNFSTANTSYTLATVTGTVPANAVYMRLTTGINNTSTTGTWYFDDYYMTKMSSQAPQVFKNNANSTTAFQVQNAGGTTLLNVDTTNSRVTMSGQTDVQTSSTSAFRVLNGSGSELVNVDTTNSIISLLGNNTGHLPTFTAGTNMSSGRWGAASVVLNGYVYQIAGSSSSFCTATNTVQYAKLNADGSLGTWGTTTVLPGSFCEPGATTYNGYIYAQGESSSTIYRARPDPATGLISSWTSLTPTGASTGASITLAAYNGYLYETNINSPTINYAKINPDGTIGTFANLSNWFSGSSRRSAGIAFANGYFYSVAGAATTNGGAAVYYGKVNSDGSIAAAATTTSLPANRTYLGVTVANGYIYALGGNNGTNVQNTVYYAPLGATGTIGSWTTDTTTLGQGVDAPGIAQHNGYIYVLGGWNDTVASNLTYYTSTPRVKVGGSLDLLSYGGENNTEGGTGGSLTAGNTNLVGTLNVSDQATFRSGASIQGNLSVAGEVSAGSFSGAGLTSCSASNSKLLYDSATKQFSCGTDRASVAIRKSADESVSSNIAVQNDNDFFFSVGAGETWAFQIFYEVNAPAAVDFRSRIDAPSGSTCRVSNSNLFMFHNTYTSSCGVSGELITDQGDTWDNAYITYGTVVTGTSGTIQFRWAQGTSSGTPAIVRGGAQMIAYKISGADLAEAYYTNDNTLMPGEVVRVDGSLRAGVQKSQGAYDSQALGVISTQPGHILGDPNIAGTDGRPVLVALSGRIPVRVSLENGPINPGDYLTTSNTPGVAMKATKPGQMIGKALEGFTSENSEAQGTVMTFANLTYADPNTNVEANGTLQNGSFGDLNVAGKVTTKDLSVMGSANINNLVVGTMKANNVSVTGNVDVSGDINLQGVGKSRNAITKKFIASKHIPIGSVVIVDPINDGQVTTTTVMGDTRVLGVALTEAQGGEAVTVAIGGSVQVKTATGAQIQGGDLLVSSAQEGAAEKSATPGVGQMIGKALGRTEDGDLVWILISLN